MAAIDVALSSFELDRFAEILRDHQIEPSSYTVVCRRFTPTLGPTTEVVQIEGPTFGSYDRRSTWLDEFQRDVAARHYSS
jgi:hypothetical protein